MKKIKEILRAFYRSCIHEFTVAIHDPGIVLFFLFLPLAYPVIYSLIYNPEVVRNVPMVVIDNDRSAESRKLVRMLDATEEVWVRGYAADRRRDGPWIPSSASRSLRFRRVTGAI